MRMRNEILTVVDRGNDGVASFVVQEDCLRTEVGGGRVQAIDEIPGKQVVSGGVAIRFWIDEDVSKGSCRVTDITGLREEA